MGLRVRTECKGSEGKYLGTLGTHVLARHIPVGSLPRSHHLPHDHAEAPHVTG